MSNDRKTKRLTWSAKPARYEWLLPGYIPAHTVTLVCGEKGAGKSTLLSSLAASVMGGPALPGTAKARRPHGVCWLTREESYPLDVIPRIQAAGVRTPRLLHVPASKDDKATCAAWTLPADFDVLRAWIDQHNIHLLILDPLGSWCDPPDAMYQPTLARPIMERLSTMARQTRCTILPIVHLNKNEGASTLNRTSGAGDLANVCRSVIRLAVDPTDNTTRYLVSVACNVAAPPRPLKLRIVSAGLSRRVEWLGEVDASVESLTSRSGDQVDRTLVAECAEWLRVTLSDDGGDTLAEGIPAVNVKKAAEQHGFSVRTLWRAKAMLGVKSKQLYLRDGTHYRSWVGPDEWPAK